MVVCQICNSKFRMKIEEELRTSGSEYTVAKIAKRYKLNEQAITRHKREHIPDVVDEARTILDQKCKEAGINRVLNDIEVLDLIIRQAPSLINKVTPQDIIRAIKLKGELLGDIKERTETNVKLEWLDEVELEN